MKLLFWVGEDLCFLVLFLSPVFFFSGETAGGFLLAGIALASHQALKAAAGKE